MAWAPRETGVECVHCGVHGRELEPMRGVPSSDGVTARGTDETAPSGAVVSHGHQRPRRVQSGSSESRACPYPRRWRHACTARRGAAIGLVLGADQKVVDSLLEWQKGDGRSKHRNVREAHQSNAGGVKYEGASQLRGTEGEHDSVAVEGVDVGYAVRELKTTATEAAALVGVGG